MWRNFSARLAVAFLTLMPGTGRAAGPEAFGPATPLAEPTGGFVGHLALAPEHGPAGIQVTVTAEGLPHNQRFDLVWRTVEGSWKVERAEYHGRIYQPVGYRIATVESDGAGRIATSFVAPDDFGFSHDVVLQHDKRLLTQAAFALDMTIKVSPESGPPGTPITIDVAGIGWRQLENSWLLLYDNNFTGWMSAVTTRGAAHFTIPAAGPVGVHVLEVLHGEFTFPYRNMQQNPEPDRPRFAFRFTVTPDAPVLPPAPATQVQTSVRNLPAPGTLVATPAFSGIGQNIVVRGGGLTPGGRYALDWIRRIG